MWSQQQTNPSQFPTLFIILWEWRTDSKILYYKGKKPSALQIICLNDYLNFIDFNNGQLNSFLTVILFDYSQDFYNKKIYNTKIKYKYK